MLYIVCLLSLGLVASSWAESRISLEVDSHTGSYQVFVGGEKWFVSGPTEFTVGNARLSTKDGSLKLDGVAKASGSDASGAYASTTLSWHDGAFLTQFREYADLIVFEQTFPKGALGTALDASHPYASRNDVSTAFPSLRATDASKAAGYLAFDGDMMGSGARHGTGGMKHLPTGVTGFGPTCFFSKDLKRSVVLSSFSQFMAASNGKREDGVAYGLQGSMMEVPAGYSLSFVIAASSKGGVNAAFEEWGDKLLHRYGKSRKMSYGDFALQYLGYSTDNGAFYYYQTEDHPPRRGPPYTPGKNYEDTLIDVKSYADKNGIPYKYILLDSWWYYQGVDAGVTNWISREDVFPHGNAFLRNRTGWPIMGHNRYWAVDNVYCKQNGGDYEFVVEKKGEGDGFDNRAWPVEQRFWDDLMYNSSQWGLFMYEQDWLDDEYDKMRFLNFNATAGRTWLLQMGSAAQRNHLTIQYCMSHSRHIMQSVEIPAVTNARASGDYHPGANQWQPLGVTGIFGWAVAVAPTKDNFWSTDIQTDSSYGDFKTIKEPYNRLQAVVSTLSKGPVAPSDKIGRSDASLILKSCAADGRLLQGDKPAMLLDIGHASKAFGHENGPAGEVWATFTELDGYTFGTVFAAVLKSDFELSVADHLAMNGEGFVHYEANSTNSISTSPTIALKACDKWDFQVYTVAPVLPNNWAFLGEPNKWVSVSKARFQNLEFSSASYGSSASVTAVGPEGEQISVAWLPPNAATPEVVECVIPRGGSVSVRVSLSSSNVEKACITPGLRAAVYV